MGVQNLWMLLAPVGRQIEIETLSTQVLAVDASIWLTQFIKAMRDDEGNMIKNAHLIGTFHRVAKLLFYRIRPVFVFDGDTPEIKRRTVARRRKRQEHQASNLRQTAQRILLNRIKLYREELKKNGGKPVANPAIDPNFLIPSVNKSTSSNAKKADEVIAVDTSDDNEDDSAEDTSSTVDDTTNSIEAESKVDQNGFDSGSDEDGMTADDIQIDISRLSRIDMDAVFALPSHLQKDMVARIQRDRRQEARDQFIPLAGNPEAYSRTQITSFLATSKLNQRIATARQKRVQQDLGKAAAAAGASASSMATPPTTEETTGLLGQGRRIASNSDRFYIYEKAANNRVVDDTEEKESGALPARSDPESSLTRETELWTPQGFLAEEGEDREHIFDRIHGSKRKRHDYDEDKVVVKKSLADFPSASVDAFVAEMGRAQRRKMAVEACRKQFLEKEKSKEQGDKPLLVAETERHLFPPNAPVNDKTKSGDSTTSVPNSITITIKADELNTLNQKAEELFPESLFVEKTAQAEQGMMTATGGDDDEDDDDIDWEDVSTPSVVQSTQASTTVATPATLENVTAASVSVQEVIVVDDESEDDEVQWEEVPASTLPAIASTGQSVSQDIAGDLIADKKKPIEKIFVESEDDEMDEDTNELYKSLQVEMDDERAEEDLNALKHEALQSAIATATNLTQWAAGAVRRALAEHTRTHGDIYSSPSKALKTATAPRPIPSPPKRKASQDSIIDLSDDTESKATDEAIVMSDAKDVDMADEQSEDQLLQLAIEKSMREDSTAAASKQNAAKSRYLQYAPPEPEPEQVEVVDVAAITEEQNELKKLRNRQMRDVEGVNDEMVEDVMELLRLFGVPFLVCPMEAEAQCATLEQLGLVDGIITDDSDIFPFGGKKVYKNIFHNQKFVEAFSAEDVKNELGVTQDEMISLALLLGSDYTDGVRGIGIVNASEVVAAYPGPDGLKQFKEWVLSFDVAEEAQRQLGKKKSQAEVDALPPRERFEYTHANARRKWELGEEFPNARVIQAYKKPQVDHSEGRFSWELPDLAGLRTYCTKVFGWEQAKADTVLLPLMEQIASFANNRHVQTRIDHFFTKYDDNVKYAKINSKRLRAAVEDKTGKPQQQKNTESTATEVHSTAAKTAATPAPRVVNKGKFTKTKKTTSTLGL